MLGKCEEMKNYEEFFDERYKRYNDLQDEYFVLYKVHPGWFGIYDRRTNSIVAWYSTLKAAKADFERAVKARKNKTAPTK